VKELIDEKLIFYEAPGPVELNRQIREFLQTHPGFGDRVTVEKVIGYLRHNYTNWPRLQAKLQDWRVWSMSEHHEIRDYVDELVWVRYEMSIPWELD